MQLFNKILNRKRTTRNSDATHSRPNQQQPQEQQQPQQQPQQPQEQEQIQQQRQQQQAQQQQCSSQPQPPRKQPQKEKDTLGLLGNTGDDCTMSVSEGYTIIVRAINNDETVDRPKCNSNQNDWDILGNDCSETYQEPSCFNLSDYCHSPAITPVAEVPTSTSTATITTNTTPIPSQSTLCRMADKAVRDTERRLNKNKKFLKAQQKLLVLHMESKMATIANMKVILQLEAEREFISQAIDSLKEIRTELKQIPRAAGSGASNTKRFLTKSNNNPQGSGDSSSALTSGTSSSLTVGASSAFLTAATPASSFQQTAQQKINRILQALETATSESSRFLGYQEMSDADFDEEARTRIEARAALQIAFCMYNIDQMFQ